MIMRAKNEQADSSPVVISLQVNDKFYAELQAQLERAVSSMTAEQKLAVAAAILILSVFTQETTSEPPPSDENLLWNYLSALQKELPEDDALRELLRAANVQLTVTDQPVELPGAADIADDDPFESFKRGWDDAKHGRTI